MVAAERDAVASNTGEELAAFDTTTDSISAATAPVTYRAAADDVGAGPTTSSAIASTFLAESGDSVASFMAGARERVVTLRAGTGARTDALLAEVERQRTSTSTATATMREQVRARGQVAAARLEGRHARALATIEARALHARSQLGPLHDDKQRAIIRAGVAALSRLDVAYRTGYDDVNGVGADKGAAAVRRAGRHAAAYLTADGQPAEIVRRVTGHEKDGFWDGYLTYNRYKARAEAATEVGKQYSEGFEKEATKQADKLMCGKSRDLEILGAMVGGGVRTLGCARDNGLDSVEQQRRQAVELAASSLRNGRRTIRQSVAATLAQLDAREAGQLALLKDYGVRQSLALERDAERAAAAVIRGTDDAASSLIAYLARFRAEADDAPAPRADALSGQLTTERRRLIEALGRATTATEEAFGNAETSLSSGFDMATTSIAALGDLGLDELEQLVDGFRGSLGDLVAATVAGYDQAEAAYVERVTADLANSVQILGAVAAGVSALLDRVNDSVAARFAEAARKTGEGFQQSLDRDFDQKVCSAAEKAAADVQPWWKTALKVLLIIVVIVVVAFVIGPAVIGAVGAAATGLAGSLGAGAALAGTIGAWVGPIVGGAIVGALAGAATQVGSNAIYGKPLTEGLKGAVIAGAVGGALGGLGGQLGQVLVGRLASTAFSGIAVRYGTEAVFDVVGNVVGDLAAGHPITFESVAMGLAIGTAAKLGVAGVGRVATTRAEVTTPGAAEPTTFGGRLAAGRTGRVAETLNNLQRGSMAFGERVGAGAASFGPRGMTVAATTQALAGARARIEAGELIPTRARGGGTAKAAEGRPVTTEEPAASAPAAIGEEPVGRGLAEPAREGASSRPAAGADETPTKTARPAPAAEPEAGPGTAPGADAQPAGRQRQPAEIDEAAARTAAGPRPGTDLTAPAKQASDAELAVSTTRRTQIGDEEHATAFRKVGGHVEGEVCSYACSSIIQRLQRVKQGLADPGQDVLRAQLTTLQKRIADVEAGVEGATMSHADVIRASGEIADALRALGAAHPELGHLIGDPSTLYRPSAEPGAPDLIRVDNLGARTGKTRAVTFDEAKSLNIPDGTTLLYVLRSADGSVVKVGETEAGSSAAARFGRYRLAADNLGLDLTLEVTPITKLPGSSTIKDVESLLARRLEAAGHIQPWDYWAPKGSGVFNRMGRQGPGTPFESPSGGRLPGWDWEWDPKSPSKGYLLPPGKTSGTAPPLRTRISRDDLAAALAVGETYRQIATRIGAPEPSVRRLASDWGLTR